MIPYRPRAATERIVLHDSHTRPEQSRLEAFLLVQGRTMGLLSTGYHFLILPDGKLVGTRPHHTQGSHCRGFDRTSIGVCLAGGLGPEGAPEDTFTAAQRETLRFLVGYLRGIYGAGVKVQGHTELGRHRFKPHACPALDMDQLRKELATQ